MAQPQMARITCGQCNGLYDSEHELRDHMQTAHRRSVPEQTNLPDSPKIQLGTSLGTSKDEWVILSVQLRNRVQDRFNPEELDAIDRFILFASQGSIFDEVCR